MFYGEFLHLFIGDLGLHFVLLAVSLPGLFIRVTQCSYWTASAMNGGWRNGGGDFNWERRRKCNLAERERERKDTKAI